MFVVETDAYVISRLSILTSLSIIDSLELFRSIVFLMLQHRTEEINVDLDTDNAISVDISDALSERDKVRSSVLACFEFSSSCFFYSFFLLFFDFSA